jgi:hypothetical protein
MEAPIGVRKRKLKRVIAYRVDESISADLSNCNL